MGLESFAEIARRIDDSGLLEDVKVSSLYFDMAYELGRLGQLTMSTSASIRDNLDKAITALVNITKYASMIKFCLAIARNLGIISEDELLAAATFIENQIVSAKSRIIDWILSYMQPDTY